MPVMNWTSTSDPFLPAARCGDPFTLLPRDRAGQAVDRRPAGTGDDLGMPHPGTPLEKLGFLTIGLFDPADPAPGHETTLQVIELGERLGFDSAFLRHRHLQH